VTSGKAQVRLVVGLGRTGVSMVEYLCGHGEKVRVLVDDPPSASSIEALPAGAELVVGFQPGGAVLEGVSEVILSPGVPPRHQVPRACGAAPVGDPHAGPGSPPCVSELGWAAARLEVPLVAITATAGKTTVTTLVARMLQASGKRAPVAGNIGLPLVDLVDASRGLPTIDAVVAEVSSFQLAFAWNIRPKVSAWLNFAPNHLDWHETLEGYRAAKAQIFANQAEGDSAVVNAEDPVVLDSLKGSLVGQVVSFGLSKGDFHLADGWLVGPGQARIIQARDLYSQAPLVLANALAALACAFSMGASLQSCAEILSDFKGLEHRLEQVGVVDDVLFVNDSKATTPHAARAAIQAFPSVVLIAGGHNKGVDLGELGLEAGEDGRVRHVVAIGEAAEEIAAAFSGRCPVQEATSMREAVLLAKQAALPGDTVLLAPACASFDWYGSYEERGEDFRKEASKLIQTGTASKALPGKGLPGKGLPGKGLPSKGLAQTGGPNSDDHQEQGKEATSK